MSHAEFPSSPGVPTSHKPQAHQPSVAPSPVPLHNPNPYYDPHGAILFQSIATLISGLGALNNFLAIFSKSVLQYDLGRDQYYALLLGQQQFAQIGSSIQGTGTKGGVEKSVLRQKVANYNMEAQAKQQTIQALTKAQSSQDQLDMGSASSSSSNQTQLGSTINQLLQMIGTIAQSIQYMSK